jgi:ankyrin repeat protein
MNSKNFTFTNRGFFFKTIKRLSVWKRDLIKEADLYGWIPIHYGSYAGNEKGVKQLLETDISIVSTRTADEDGLNTALHIAATHGNVGVMKMLLSYHPDCWEAVNSRGQNVLHIAVDMERKDVMEFILDKSWSWHLINKKDNEGNVPLHVLHGFPRQYNYKMLWNHEGAATRDVFNNKNVTPDELVEEVSTYYDFFWLQKF